MKVFKSYPLHTFCITLESVRSMDYTQQIIEEVLALRKNGMSIPKIAHAISRTHPCYCKKTRHQKNFCGYDVVRILEGLKAQGRLPTTLLDSLKRKIGEKGRGPKPKKVKTPPPPILTFNF